MTQPWKTLSRRNGKTNASKTKVTRFKHICQQRWCNVAPCIHLLLHSRYWTTSSYTQPKDEPFRNCNHKGCLEYRKIAKNPLTEPDLKLMSQHPIWLAHTNRLQEQFLAEIQLSGTMLLNSSPTTTIRNPRVHPLSPWWCPIQENDHSGNCPRDLEIFSPGPQR